MVRIISVSRLLIILLSIRLSSKQLLAVGRNNTDYESLIAVKNQFLKQSNANSSTIFASSWNATNHFCSWEGVTCGFKHCDRVTALNLHSVGLSGPLPPSIFNLTFLRRLDLSLNELYGEIPQILACLPRLQHLNLSFNSFDGDIHAILVLNDSSVLQVLDLAKNHMITGKIPIFINSMSPLKFLRFDQNNIIGTIPPSLTNLSFLQSFYALSNNLEGVIPPEIGVLHKLKDFNVADNKLSGKIPSSFYNLSSLRRVSVTTNHFSGYISSNIAQAFPNLVIFYFAENNFIGSLDQALQNVTSLVIFDISINNFTGVVPPDFGKMYNLRLLNMESNQFEANDAKDWKFLDSLTNCTSLQILGLYGNNFHGILPKSIGNLSIELQKISLGYNHILGRIPFELDRYNNLIGLGMEENHLEGSIPKTIGMLGRLQILSLTGNDLTGFIPYSLENLTSLSELYLGYNQLTGHIPLSLKNLQHLSYLDLSHNNLTGWIPKEIFFIPSFSNSLYLSYNSFTGSLPLEVGRLTNLYYLDVSNNNLEGKIPKAIGSCQSLLGLEMKYNFFQGPIPISLSNLKSLEKLDISHNNLSGVIPQFLQKLVFLKKLNLSFNNLEGEVPYDGVFANSSEICLVGNEKLCGGIVTLHLPNCVAKSSSTKLHHLIKIIVVMLFILLLCYTLLYRRKKKNDLRNTSGLSISPPFPKISYAKLAEATNAFSTTHLVGCGRYGSVFAGNLRDYDDIVAIKVFNLEVHGALKSFTYECDALRSIRHRNLVRVLSSCSSLDIQGNEFKALIFEFMPKGNLDTHLHQEYEIDEDVVLSLEKRLSIAINVAEALEYLHHSCEPPIIHCDIKPSNILLDNNLIAHVGDFGLSRMLYENVNISLQASSNQSGIKGTIGYIAPEYGEVAPLSPSADVYSFGIVLLEMLTGRRPTDDIFSDNLTLHNHIKMTLPHGINYIVDCKMFTKEQRDASNRCGEQPRWFSCQSTNKCLLSLTELALSCSVSSPKERPSMKDVTAKLNAIRVSYVPSI
ncbi:receptor kinase-like protein Xa21 [Phalaenopsis equestris]|uniref:receptor kinase-like protein Xa21 n=1 Tax=Phalaenopsis equestris TaxID=78828 RepID=UPI0009E3BCAA|nr:receptor kinase-like protein Xa21 [Phalaenopsis equestris]